MFDIDENTRSGSIVGGALRSEWKAGVRAKSNSEEKILLMRILRLLGSLGSYSHFLVNS